MVDLCLEAVPVVACTQMESHVITWWLLFATQKGLEIGEKVNWVFFW